MSFTVHSVPGSPFGRAVLTTLIEQRSEWRLAPVAPSTPGGMHRARHPFGRIPVLDHNAFAVYEPQAILRYLDRVLPAPPLTPADSRPAARMDQVMNIWGWYLFRGVGDVIGSVTSRSSSGRGASPTSSWRPSSKCWQRRRSGHR